MLGAITILLLFQLAGEVIAQALELPVPGPVIGMALLLMVLIVRGSAPESMRTTANGLLSNLSILFIPGGVGVMLFLPLIAQQWLPIFLSLLLSTTLTLIVTALVLRVWMRRSAQDQDAGEA